MKVVRDDEGRVRMVPGKLDLNRMRTVIQDLGMLKKNALATDGDLISTLSEASDGISEVLKYYDSK